MYGYGTVGLYNFAVAQRDLPVSLAYEIVKAVFDHHEEMMEFIPLPHRRCRRTSSTTRSCRITMAPSGITGRCRAGHCLGRLASDILVNQRKQRRAFTDW